MQFQNKIQIKNRIAYLASLTLLFSYAELFIPKFIPFLRLGLGNIIILLAFSLPFPYFLLLNMIKILANCMLQGTLFSPFLIISLGQGFASAMVMYVLSKISVIKTKSKSVNILSLYGISLIGSAVSAIIQILLTGLYLGKGTYALLGPMLLFSAVSGLVTAFFACHLKIQESYPELIKSQSLSAVKIKDESNLSKIIIGILVLICAGIVIYIDRIVFILPLFAAALIFQLICHRKIMILPYLSLWLLVLVCYIFIPNGEVLFRLWNLTVTKGALATVVIKAGKLSILMSVSQAASSIRPSDNSESIISLTLAYFSGFTNSYRNAKGNIYKKLQAALDSKELIQNSSAKKGITLLKTLIFTVIVIIFFVISLI